jgi:hypothetical protein
MTEVSLDDPEANELLDDNIDRLMSGGSSISVVALKKITRQMVAGMLYGYTGTFKVQGKATKCEISIWDRPWMPDNEKNKIKASCPEEIIFAEDDGWW